MGISIPEIAKGGFLYESYVNEQESIFACFNSDYALIVLGIYRTDGRCRCQCR